MDDLMDDAFMTGNPEGTDSGGSSGSSTPMPEPGRKATGDAGSSDQAERTGSRCDGPAPTGGKATGAKRGAGAAGSKARVQLPASCLPPQTAFPARHLVWIVYGGTGHMGRSLVKSALAHGDNVTMVGRTHETSPAAIKILAESVEAAASVATEAAMGSHHHQQHQHRRSPSTPRTGQCLGTLCDVRFRESVDAVVQQTLSQFGRIDVVANCSGYGVVGACEDQDEFDLRNQFQTNFMGTLHILQATLPIFRRQQSAAKVDKDGDDKDDADDRDDDDKYDKDDKDDGDEANGGRYLIFSSTSGALGVPGLGPYCATKYAIEGLIEAMLYEVDAFDIKATLVEPGLVRRDDPDKQPDADDDGSSGSGGGSGSGSDKSKGKEREDENMDKQNLPTWGHFLIKPPSEPYAGPSAPARHSMRMMQWLGDRQPTSVVQCAEIIWQLAHCKFPPLRLPLGSYAIESIRDRLRSVTEELEDWRHLNFPLPPEATGGGGAATTPGGHAAAAGGTTTSIIPPAEVPKDKDEGAGISAAIDDDEEMAD